MVVITFYIKLDLESIDPNIYQLYEFELKYYI